MGAVGAGLLATDDVQARPRNLLGATTSGEVALHGELVQAVGGAGDVLAGTDTESVRHLRDLVLALVDGLLVRVHLKAEDATAASAATDARGDAALGDEVAVHLAGAARGLGEGGVGVILLYSFPLPIPPSRKGFSNIIFP